MFSYELVSVKFCKATRLRVISLLRRMTESTVFWRYDALFTGQLSTQIELFSQPGTKPAEESGTSSDTGNVAKSSLTWRFQVEFGSMELTKYQRQVKAPKSFSSVRLFW